ncbi:hypothetical protein [Pseudomonas sp.]|uniref:hypothetical protein n=1 Tax=Pseudomonas sp. TaxID=306 RepID=UPI0028B0C574|nr:hypothetical protein [Pseudomonas sp.]
MPTENRSSNTEMVSDKLPPCADDVFKNGVSACLVGDVPKHAAETICQSLSAVTGWKIDWHYFGGRTHIKALAPAPRHPEPIAWMVGTAFWWTKEEAERDAAETGLPIVGLGPMAGVAPAQQHQGEPVALPARKDPTQHWVEPGGVNKAEGWNSYHDEIAKLGPLYTRPAPANIAEVEREPECFCVEHGLHIETLRAHLAEAHALLREADEFMYIMTAHDGHAKLAHRYGKDWWDAIEKLRGKVCTALSASAEPSAPVEIDERVDFERHVILTTGRPIDSELKRHPVRHDEYECRTMQTRWNDWQARAALDRKPS